MNIKELLKQLDDEQIKRVFLSSLTYPDINSIVDEARQTITFNKEINWKDVKVQSTYTKTVQDNINIIIELMEVMSKDILPEVFNQIIITYCNAIPLLIKMEQVILIVVFILVLILYIII